jgi:predicted permease
MVFKFVIDRTNKPDLEHRQDGNWLVRIGTLYDDARIATRMLLRKPGFVLAAVLTLGLGIGANTTIFSLVYWVLIKPLPYPDAGQLVSVYRIDPDVTGRDPSPSRLANLYSVPYEVYGDWAEMSSSFESFGAYFTTSFTLTGGDRAERLSGAMVTSEVFSSLGIAAIIGRTFQARDDDVGMPDLAILSHGLWQSRYGSDPTVIGQQVVLSGYSYEVVGVMPPRFGFPDGGVQIWTTFEDRRKTSPVRSSGYLQVIARLKDGVSIQRAQLDVDAVARRIGELHPEEVEHGIGLFPRKTLEVANVRSGLVLLLGAVGLVLLIACANIANLLLVRATERRRELGVRMALGADRGRLLVQFLTESALLSLAGGIAGCVMAVSSLTPFKAAFPGGLPRADLIAVDYRLLVFAALLSVLTGLLTGVLPALRAMQTPIVNVLQDGGRGSAGGRRRNRTQAVLVISEVALAFVLLVGAGLFIRSLSRLTAVNYGFDADNLLTVGVSLPSRYRESDEASLAFFEEFTERLRAIPGVSGVGGANQMPFVGGWSTPPIIVETNDGLMEDVVHRTIMDPEYFSTMNVPIVAGRGFNSGDRDGSTLVAVVSDAMVSRFWPNESPLGRRVGGVGADGDTVWVQVVGVAADVRYRLNMEPMPSIHLPLAQWPHWYQWIILRTAIEPSVITPSVQETLAALDPEIPIQVLQLEERINNSNAVANPRFRIMILSCLAGLAALLAFVGIYGVLAYTVQQRSQEIGVQLALGANTGDVLKRFLVRGLQMTGVGLTVGVALSVGASRVISSLLFETSPTDPVTLVAVALLVATAALGASYLPALRATRVDPVEVLRRD